MAHVNREGDDCECAFHNAANAGKRLAGSGFELCSPAPGPVAAVAKAEVMWGCTAAGAARGDACRRADASLVDSADVETGHSVSRPAGGAAWAGRVASGGVAAAASGTVLQGCVSI